MMPGDFQGIPEGVVIREVLPDSPAANSPLKPEMIIKKVNDQKVTYPAEFYHAMSMANGPTEITYASRDNRGEDRATLNIR